MDAAIHPLRRWRRETGTSLMALAGDVSVTPSHLSEIERGENGLSFDLAVRLSKRTGLPLESFKQMEAAE